MRLTDIPTSVQALGPHVQALYVDNPYGLESLLRAVVDGLPCGGFLSAVLENDLRMAAGRADDTNARHLFAWAMVVANWAPAYVVGNPDRLEAHMERQRALPNQHRAENVPPACRRAYRELITAEEN